ncbi:aKG-HExxH-type peptide beta-hydroxylase [Krasilnikovia sp. MM14-A1259]|uniref:aKG-HExxH-type peptide beta-hydroxylase n=1 Tax=Krasilnikovia sp. MM14-A1259 TaxID=3373539 RepID=UPI003828A783
MHELGGGGGGVPIIELFHRAQYSKNLLLIRTVVASAARHGHPGATAAARSYRMLRRMTERAPSVARRLIASPLTGLWALHTAFGLEAKTASDDIDPGGLAAIIGQFVAPDDPPSRIRAEAAGRCLDLRIVTTAPRLLATVAGDATPATDRHGLRRWHEWIGAGWHRLAHDHPDVADEVAATMSILVPQARAGLGYSSATLRHGFGMLVMSPPPDAYAVAATLAHEVQHAKLSAMMDLFPLIRPGATGRFYAPWRSDPRPPGALLHGAYAHLGVTGFWRRELFRRTDPEGRAEAEVEFVRWHTATTRATEELTAANVLSPVGQRFVAAMTERLAGWCTEPVSQVSRAEAARRNALHRRQWLSRNP